ncbi:MAG TPA: GNAT family protein [Saprospiraceae bacterium]|nr:GNAT family protein [Saprospiraceae bacterium]
METRFENILTRNHIVLRKAEIQDAKDIYKWRTGAGGIFLRQPENYSIQMQEDWIKSRGNDEINYIIIEKHTLEKLGTIGIYDVNNDDKIANVGRLIIKDEYLTKSHPYGLEALLLCYDYLFNIMLYRKMTGDILATNKAMYKLQIFLGMKEEGYLKRHVLINGKEEDLYIMSIFKEEFEQNYKKKISFLLKGFK